VAGSCECINEPLNYINGRRFLDQLKDYQKNPTTWSKVFRTWMLFMPDNVGKAGLTA